MNYCYIAFCKGPDNYDRAYFYTDADTLKKDFKDNPRMPDESVELFRGVHPEDEFEPIPWTEVDGLQQILEGNQDGL